jgi:hypothetical protein
LRTAGAALAVLSILAAAPAAGAQEGPPPRDTFLLSRAATGGYPNGPSTGAAISGDRQLAGLTAFTSFASDLVPGDSNGVSDVFVVRRADPLADGLRGMPWLAAGPPQIVSRGMGGAPADGPSYGADLDGDQLHDGLDARNRPDGRDGPHCVAFVSAASNLVPGDTNGRPDGFVADLRSGRIERVTVDSRGRQVRGTTYDIEVDGSCGRVAFTSDARGLALTKSTFKRLRRPAAAAGLVSDAASSGQRQVYARVLPSAREPDDAGLRGVTFLASAAGGRAADGPSYDVALGQLGRSGDCRTGCSVTSGDTVAYTSEATNLSPADRGGGADVYKTSFARTYSRRRGSRTSYAPPLRTTMLVSATRTGAAGNGPSGRAAINPNGRYVAFATEATDVLPCVALHAGLVCDTNGVTDVARVDTWARRPRAGWASAAAAIGQPGNGASDRPSLTVYGSLFFESDATNLQRQPASGGLFSDRNGFRDVFFWSNQTQSQSLQSRDSDDQIPLTAANRDPEPPYSPALGASGAATSAYNNYVVFESGNPALDLPLARAALPQVVGDRGAAEAEAAANPALHQVYLRYVGRR